LESDDEVDYEVDALEEEDADPRPPVELEKGEIPQDLWSPGENKLQEEELEEGEIPQDPRSPREHTLQEEELEEGEIPQDPRSVCPAFNSFQGCLDPKCVNVHMKFVCAFFISPAGCGQGSSCLRSHSVNAPREPGGRQVKQCCTPGCDRYCLRHECSACYSVRRRRRRPRRSVKKHHPRMNRKRAGSCHDYRRSAVPSGRSGRPRRRRRVASI